MLRTSSSIQKLVVRSNTIGDDQGEVLVRSLARNSSLRQLDLSNTGIGKKTALAVAEILRSGHPLYDLSLSNNKWDDDDLRLIASSLTANRSLAHLSMEGHFSYPVWASLACQLEKNKTLISARLGQFVGPQDTTLVELFSQSGFYANFAPAVPGIPGIDRKLPAHLEERK